MPKQPPPRWVMRLQWRSHKLIYRLSGGRIGSRVIGMPVLKLTTTGRRSGQPREVLLTYLDHPDGFVVAASNAGAAHDPAWWLNLQSQPAAVVEVGRRATEVRARLLEGDERDQAWHRLVEINDGYRVYAESMEREVPVVLLQPTS